MITTCIHFQRTCDEAISFYKEALSADVKEIYYAKDAPEGSGMEEYPPNFVMHSTVVIRGMNFSLTDGGETPVPHGNFSFLIFCNTPEEVTETFEKLAVGGTINEQLAPVFFSPLFGEVIDRYGVTWQVMVQQH